MADTPNAPVASQPATYQQRVEKFVWAMSGVSTGRPVRIADFPDKTFHHWDNSSSWGGATLVWEGSNDERADPTHANYASSEWQTLTDTTETALTFAATDGGGQILQNYEWIRPKTTGGTNTAVTATILAAKPER